MQPPFQSRPPSTTGTAPVRIPERDSANSIAVVVAFWSNSVYNTPVKLPPANPTAADAGAGRLSRRDDARLPCNGGLAGGRSRNLRDRFGLSAQMAVRGSAPVREACKRNGQASPFFAPFAAIPCNQRLMRAKGQDRVSLRGLWIH
jgi:hypothetical protein